MSDEKKETPQQRYDRLNMTKITIRFHNTKDKDILDEIEGMGLTKPAAIKRLLRKAIYGIEE